LFLIKVCKDTSFQENTKQANSSRDITGGFFYRKDAKTQKKSLSGITFLGQN